MSSKIEIEEADANASAFFVATDRADPPIFTKTIRPYRSLPLRGFAWVIAILGIGFLIPLLAFVGSIVMWGILIPCVLTLFAVWFAIQHSYRQADTHEIITLWPDLLAIQRVNPKGQDQYWHANPHWVKLHIKDTSDCEGYLTITGGNREIELGAFLAPEQRIDLRYRIEKAMRLG